MRTINIKLLPINFAFELIVIHFKITIMKEIKNLYDELNWAVAPGYSEGTKRKVLRHDNNKGQTILLKLPEGFYMAPHSHITAEQHFVLEGEYQSGGESYSAGSYQIFSSGEQGLYLSTRASDLCL